MWNGPGAIVIPAGPTAVAESVLVLKLRIRNVPLYQHSTNTGLDTECIGLRSHWAAIVHRVFTHRSAAGPLLPLVSSEPGRRKVLTMDWTPCSLE